MTSPWPRQGLAFAAFFLAYYGYIGVFAPYASLYFAHLGATPAQVGVLMALIQVMRIFGPNLWGWLADHGGRRSAMLRLTAWGALVSFAGFWFGTSFAWLFAVMVVLNLFSSAQAPLSEAMLAAELRGDFTHYGRLRLWGSVGFILAVSAAGPLLDRFGVSSMLWLAALMLALTGLASQRLQDTPAAPVSGPRPSVRAQLKKPAVQAFFVSTFLMLAAHAAIYAYYSLYLEQLGYSNSVIGMMWSLGVVAEIVFFFYQAPLFRRFGVRALMLASLVLAVLRFAMIGWGAASLTVLVLAQLLHAATFGIHNSASVATLQRWFAGPLQARGQALFVSISYGLGGTLGSLAFARVWDLLGPGMVFVLAAVLSAGGLAAALLSYRWQAKEEGPA